MLVLIASIVLLCFGSLNCESSPADKLKIAVSNVKEEHDGANVVVEKGKVPDWLDGSFIRNACGAFGDIDNNSTDDVTRINHLFDCIDMGSSYSFKGGKTTFYNKYYDTRLNDIWQRYGRNMTKSKAFFSTAFAAYDVEQFNNVKDELYAPGKVSETGHVAFWQIGDKVAIWGETASGVEVDVHNVEIVGAYPFKDDNLGYPNTSVLINTPAHNQQEPDGTIWSTTGVYSPINDRQWESKLALWTIRNDTREVVTEIPYDQFDLAFCYGQYGYPELNARPGYMHSFAMTQNYIILPVTSYLMDPCGFVDGTPGVPFFPRFFEWYGNHNSSLVVIRKSDGEIMARISTGAFFVTHQLNSYEDNGQMHLDMLVYDDSSIYEKYTFIDSILKNQAYETGVRRFTINMVDWTLTSQEELRSTDKEAVEMSNINPAILMKPYKYAYLAKRIFLTDNEVIKLNVQTKAEVSYVLPEGMFIQEPFFVASPDAVDEDDGVLLVQGVDANKEKGFLVVIDAKTMTLTAHVTAPGLTLFGLHNTYYARPTEDVIDSAGELKFNLLLVLAMSLALLCLRI